MHRKYCQQIQKYNYIYITHLWTHIPWENSQLYYFTHHEEHLFERSLSLSITTRWNGKTYQAPGRSCPRLADHSSNQEGFLPEAAEDDGDQHSCGQNQQQAKGGGEELRWQQYVDQPLLTPPSVRLADHCKKCLYFFSRPVVFSSPLLCSPELFCQL